MSNIHTIPPTIQHTHTIILLHGRGSSAVEFHSEFFESQASDSRYLPDIFPNFKWVFPCAAVYYAETEGEEMHQWFDMASVQQPDERMDLQKQGLKESVEFILQVLRDEAKHIPMERIVLGGISQGCATAILALLCSGVKLAGFVGFGSWLPHREEFQHVIDSTPEPAQYTREFGKLLDLPEHQKHLVLGKDKGEVNLQTPVFLEHSEDDDVVPIENGLALCKGLKGLGMSVKMSCYADGGHWVNEPLGIDDMVDFLRNVN